MKVDELFQSVECDDFAISASQLASPESAIGWLRTLETYQQLFADLSEGNDREWVHSAVTGKIVELCDDPGDPKYRHQWDEAIGFYLDVLGRVRSPYLGVATGRIASTPRLHFAERVAVEADRSREGAADTDATSDPPPPRPVGEWSGRSGTAATSNSEWIADVAKIGRALRSIARVQAVVVDRTIDSSSAAEPVTGEVGVAGAKTSSASAVDSVA